MPTANIKRGHRGSHVAQIQKKINQTPQIIGFLHAMRQDPLVEDGIFGALTHDRVVLWQSLQGGLKVDGIVGPKTWEAMFHQPFPSLPTAPPVPVPDTPVSAGPPVHVYITDTSTPGYMDRRTGHVESQIVRVIADRMNGVRVSDFLRYQVAARNLRVASLVWNTHGVGGGKVLLQFKSKEWFWQEAKLARVPLSEAMRALLEPLRGRFEPNAQMYVFACSFAAPEVQVSDADNAVASPEEITLGHGWNETVKVARAFGIIVHAGFSNQFGSIDSFKGPWLTAYPNGQAFVNYTDRKMTVQDYNTWVYLQKRHNPGFIAEDDLRGRIARYARPLTDLFR